MFTGYYIDYPISIQKPEHVNYMYNYCIYMYVCKCLKMYTVYKSGEEEIVLGINEEYHFLSCIFFINMRIYKCYIA